MKSIAVCCVGTVLTTICILGFVVPGEPLPIGSEMPLSDHHVLLPDSSLMRLSEAYGQNGLLVVFVCNTCPWVRKWEDRFNEIASVAEKHFIGVIFLNSNEALRSTTESLTAMRERSIESGYKFVYAADIDNIVADAFGAVRTPDVYLFDALKILRYRGAIDNNARDAAAATPYVKEAMKLMANGIEIAQPVQNAIGCTIKRATQ